MPSQEPAALQALRAALAAGIDMDEPANPAAPSKGGSRPPGGPAVSQSRLVSLEAELRRSQQGGDRLRRQLQELQEQAGVATAVWRLGPFRMGAFVLQVAARDAELLRLGQLVAQGRDPERLVLQRKAEGADRALTALQQQINYLNRKLAEAEAAAQQLGRCEQARVEADTKLRVRGC